MISYSLMGLIIAAFIGCILLRRCRLVLPASEQGPGQGLGACKRTRTDLMRAEGGCCGQQACCIPRTLLGRGSDFPDSHRLQRAESGVFDFAVLVQCRSKQRFPSECLKQKKAQAFNVSAFPPTPASQGNEKPLSVNRSVPFLDKLWCSEMGFFPLKCWFSQ